MSAASKPAPGAGRVLFEAADGIARITFDRPAARNAMTFTMYRELAEACESIAADPAIRVAVLRGAGGEAFVAGTDIEEFRAFSGGEDGIRYEERIDAIVSAVEGLRVPTVAVVEGWCVGGGLAIAAACDLRIATPSAQFGVPIARTLGNCLSVGNVARLMDGVGTPLAKRMLVGAETIGGEAAHAAGFVMQIAEPDEIDDVAIKLAERLARQAPVTMRLSKEAMRRIREAALPAGDDLVREAYGSADFREGVDAFLTKRRPVFTGR